MSMVHKYKKDGGKASPAIKKAARGISDKAARDFASTKTKNLPETASESFEQKLDKALFGFID